MRTNIICGIYKITNLINNKLYIGCSMDIYTRFDRHKYLLRNNKHKNEHLQSAWNIYGEMNFKFEVIFICNIQDLDYSETFFISTFKSFEKLNGYNKTKGGDNKGRLFSNETKKKMSIASSGKRNWNYGRISTFKGKHHTKETKQILALSRTGKPNARRKKVNQYTLNGDYIKTFDCLTLASRLTNTNINSIVSCCKGKRQRTINGFTWKYYNP